MTNYPRNPRRLLSRLRRKRLSIRHALRVRREEPLVRCEDVLNQRDDARRPRRSILSGRMTRSGVGDPTRQECHLALAASSSEYMTRFGDPT